MSASFRTVSVLTSLLAGITPLVTGCEEAELPTNTTASTQPPQPAIAVEPSELALAVGQTAQLQASLGGEKGLPLPGLTWTSSNPDVAIVSPFGLVAARAEGIAIITAQVGTMSDGARVVVNRKVGTN